MCHPTNTRCQEESSSEKESHSQNVSTWGEGRGVGSQCLRDGASIGDDEKVLGMMVVVVALGHVLAAIALYTQKWLHGELYAHFYPPWENWSQVYIWHPWRVWQNQIKYCLRKPILFLESIGSPRVSETVARGEFSLKIAS